MQIALRSHKETLINVERMPHYNQVCRPYVVTIQNFTLTFESYMARLVVKIGHQKDMCYDEVGRCP
jgi:hypothetical protein